MPQYTSTATSGLGLTVITVLNTETNLQTITVTAPTGQTATATQPANLTRPSNSTIDNLRSQLEAGGAFVNGTDISGALRSSNTKAVREAENAEAAATATNTTVPDAPAPPPPVSPESNPALPAVTPDPLPVNQEFIDANQEPQTVENLVAAERQAEFIAANDAPAVDNDPAYNNSFAEDAAASAAAAPVDSDLYGYEYDGNAPYATSNTRGISGDNINARSQAVLQDSTNFGLQQDWRVRLTLAPNADGYLYKASDPGILRPLIATKGIIFPYTPTINVTYSASYDPTNLTHSNYKILQYQSSAIESIQITGDFTAQDNFEADYLLAVIHFLRTCTKMFYGQDEKPKLGTPPPMLFLKGFGAFQFDMHPLVITNFTYNLPNDIDYIRASSTTTLAGVPKDTYNQSNINSRLPSNITEGGNPAPVVFNNPTSGSIEPTYVPTKLQIQLSCMPVVSRKDISDRFSFKDYANGKLLRGSKQNNPGIW